LKESEPTAAEIKEVYARFGLAMYLAQCVERKLATLLATKYGPGVREMTQTQYDDLLRSLFKQTFGSLTKRLYRNSVETTNDLEQSLEKALEYRNWLAHNYFWERAGHFMTPKGCLFMVEELQEIVDYLYDFEHQLGSVLNEWTRQNGISEGMIEIEMQKLLQEAQDDL